LSKQAQERIPLSCAKQLRRGGKAEGPTGGGRQAEPTEVSPESANVPSQEDTEMQDPEMC